MAHRAEKSGLSKDTHDKLLAKYDAALAEQCMEWIKDTIQSSPEGGDSQLTFNCSGESDNVSEVLHDGLILARLANALMPGKIPASKLKKPPTLPFKQMELISMFIDVAREFGVPAHESFQTVDLFDGQNLHQVVICLQSVGRKAKGKGLSGFGPKESASQPREFTEEQLRASQNIIGLQMGTNKGASQAGMNMGKQRKIID